jgi:hypothetical protein
MFKYLLTQAFSNRNQNIMAYSWVNPRKQWAGKFGDYDIGNDESFIMFGYGSPINEFSNKSKPPGELSPAELKAEILARVQTDPNIDSRFIALALLIQRTFMWSETARQSNIGILIQ